MDADIIEGQGMEERGIDLGNDNNLNQNYNSCKAGENEDGPQKDLKKRNLNADQEEVIIRIKTEPKLIEKCNSSYMLSSACTVEEDEDLDTKAEEEKSSNQEIHDFSVKLEVNEIDNEDELDDSESMSGEENKVDNLDEINDAESMSDEENQAVMYICNLDEVETLSYADNAIEKDEEMVEEHDARSIRLNNDSDYPANKSSDKSKRKTRNKQQHECQMCGYIFKEQFNIVSHLRNVHNICNLCDRYFDTKEELYFHLESFHRQSTHEKSEDKVPYICGICKKTFRRKGYLMLHMKLHKDEQKLNMPTGLCGFQCKVCKIGYKKEGNFIKHLRTEHLMCNICEKRFGTRATLNQHIENEHGIDVKDIKSTSMNKISQVVGGFNEGEGKIVNSSDGIEKFQEENSDIQIKEEEPISIFMKNNENVDKNTPDKKGSVENSYNTNSNEELHGELIEHEEKEERCPEDMNQAKVEEFETSKNKSRVFECKECNKIYPNYKNFIKHKATIHNTSEQMSDKPFSCSICPSEYKSKRQLIEHMSMHTGDKMYNCQFCQKTFARRQHLVQHLRQHTGETPFECEICDKKFRRKSYLTQHMRMHDIGVGRPVVELQCKFCHISVCSKWSLYNHLQTHAEYLEKLDKTNLYKCKECGKCFEKNTALENHMRRQHSEQKPYQCQVCGAGFRHTSHLSNHMLKHSGEKPHQCDVCGKRFARPDTLRNHSKVHVTNPDHQCVQCKKVFASSYFLKNHLVSCKGPKLLGKQGRKRKNDTLYFEDEQLNGIGDDTCMKTDNDIILFEEALLNGKTSIVDDTCVKTDNENMLFEEALFNRVTEDSCSMEDNVKEDADNLSKEEVKEEGENDEIENVEEVVIKANEHDEGKPYSCSICNSSFKKRYKLITHMKTHTGEKDHACEFCEKKFRLKQHLKQHLRQHTNDSPYICEMCGKRFRRLSYVKGHMKAYHSESDKFKCPTCQLTFSNKRLLRNHRRSHTHVKEIIQLSHVCEECGMRFSNSELLEKHKSQKHKSQKHKGDKPYKCEECGVGFRCSWHLKGHMLTHSGEKPFQCEYCGKQYKQAYSLRNHSKIHNRNSLFQCTDCKKVLASSFYLEKHKTTCKLRTNDKVTM